MDRKSITEKFGLIAESEVMLSVVNKIAQVAPTDITVLLQGESGVGKDVVAKAIHGLSKTQNEPIVIVNCGAIPEGIIESELFGHEKGSFTGAHETREGYFEKATNGTIFLDEIGDTPKNVQVKIAQNSGKWRVFQSWFSQIPKVRCQNYHSDQPRSLERCPEMAHFVRIYFIGLIL
jgi:transcriptional regulator with GAF, ATPase, and Fis domain